MNKKRATQIENIALNLLSESNQQKIPVDVERIAKDRGLQVQLLDFGDDVSGVFLSDGTKASIGVNQNNSVNRQRFTIAHELGHYILGHQRQSVFIDSPSKYYTILFRDNNSSTGEFIQEREANAFAAALLMPKSLLINEIQAIYEQKAQIDEDFDLIKGLCKKFHVSKQAMTLRLTNLDLLW